MQGAQWSPVLVGMSPPDPHTLPGAEQSSRPEGPQLGCHSPPVGAQRGDTVSPSSLPKTEERGMRGGGQRLRETERQQRERQRETETKREEDRGRDREMETERQ